MSHVNGFVAAVPSANREAFRAHAAKAAVVFKECGALSVVECWGDDVPDGKVTSFPMMEDPRMRQEANPMPFDGKRMIYGGFEVILNES